MAAVAAEPGAAVVPTTTTTTITTIATRNEAQLEAGAGESAVGTDHKPGEYSPITDLVVRRVKDGDVVEEERGHVGPELELQAAAGKAPSRAVVAEGARVQEDSNEVRISGDNNDLLSEYMSSDRLALDVFSPVAVEAEVGCCSGNATAVYQKSILLKESQPSAVFLHSFPAHPPATEAGPSLAEPAEPTTNVKANECRRHSLSRRIQSVDVESYRALIKPDPETASNETGSVTRKDAAEGALSLDLNAETPSLQGPQPMDVGTSYNSNCDVSSSVGTHSNSVVTDDLPLTCQPGSVVNPARRRQDSCSSSPCRSPKRKLLETNFKQEKMGNDPSITESSSAESKPAVPPGSVAQLTPGSEVRVSLDHIIDDALVVSFQVGEKIFSGVLMDLSKRFGPYGIPITVLPHRDYKDRPQQSMQLQTTPQLPFRGLEETGGATKDRPDGDKEEAMVQSSLLPPPPPPDLCVSKPPPLFQEGAPYPPPLFIRDSYNQSLPQPPPRKIKRPKRRYRYEEPTSIMNAIRLRPRQVLCDKCKGVVSGGGHHRETRRATAPPTLDPRSEDTRRRRQADSGGVAGKRLRSDGPRADTQTSKRSSSSSPSGGGLRVSSSSSSSSSSGRVLRGVSSSSSSSHSANSSGGSRVHLKLNSKQKVLCGKSTGNVECTKARRQVLKQLSRSSSQAATTRSQQAALQRTPSYRRQQRKDTPSSSSATPNPHGARAAAPNPHGARTVTANLHGARTAGPNPHGARTVTRSAALQAANGQSQKIHFTRRLRHLGSLASGSPGPHQHHSATQPPLPPRMRLKPQRYRTEDGQSPATSSSSQPPQPSPPTPPKPQPGQERALSGRSTPASPPPAPSGPSPSPAPPILPDVPACPASPAPSTSSSSTCTGERQERPRAEEEVEEEGEEGRTGGGGGEGGAACVGEEGCGEEAAAPADNEDPPPPPPPSSSSSSSQPAVSFSCLLDVEELKSSSSTETLDLPPPGGDLLSSSSSSSSYSSSSTPPPPVSCMAPPSSSSATAASSSIDGLPPHAAAPPPGDEDEERARGDGREREDEEAGGSSRAKPSMFSKSVSKWVGVDGRAVCVGDIVWAKIYGFPWWPARVVAITVNRREDTGLTVRQEARVSWFGSPTTSYLPLAQLSPFLESFRSRFDKKRKGLYRRAIAEAARAAKQLTPEVRALLTQFET